MSSPMIDKIDDQLAKWAKGAVPDISVSFEAPSAKTKGPTVCLYLFDVMTTRSGRGARRPPDQFLLRYLVLLLAAPPSEAHRVLSELLISAAENTEFEIEQSPIPSEIWQAFGLVPQPSFVLRMPFRHERDERVAPPVRHPLKIDQVVLESLKGKIFVNKLPMKDANVVIPKLKLNTRTDVNGNFSFAALPSEPAEKDLVVRVKGREFNISTNRAERQGDQYLFDLQLED